MAVITKIRNKAGLLVAVVIGFALLAFILGDFLNQGGKARYSPSKMQVAKVNGKGISYEIFEHHLNELEKINEMQRGKNNLDNELREQIRTQAWEDLVQERIMEREYARLGLTVSADELDDMIRGDNPHPFIAQLFTNPETGQIDRGRLYGFLESVVDDEENPDKDFWFYIEQMIYKQRMITKYNNLVQKGLYATTLEAEKRNEDNNKNVGFSYIMKRYTDISDSSVTITEVDIKKYYNDYKERFKQEESRDIRYVTFTVLPSEKDYTATESLINDYLSDFTKLNGNDAIQFINLNSDNRYKTVNYKKGDLPEKIDSFAFNSEVGDIYGPYFEDEKYTIAKLTAVNYIPDSVRASHILLQVNQNNPRQTQALADSLKKMIENGVDFKALAVTNSADGSAKDGGDLGWFKEGDMVKPFSDSCFYGKTGDLKIVYSQFGVHIVRITDQSRPVKKVQVGYLSREVTPSTPTDQFYFNQASEFAGLNNTSEKFMAAIENSPDLSDGQANNVEPMGQVLGSITNARPVIKWAYDAELNDVSKVLQVDNNYIVALVTGVHEKGYTPIEEVRAEIELELQKQKKGELFAKEVAELNSNSLDDLASQLKLPVENVANVRFTSYIVPSVGQEYKVIGTVTNLEEGEISDPIVGENGIFVVTPDKVTVQEQAIMNIEQQKNIITRGYSGKSYMAIQTLRELANLQDYRVRYF